MGLFLSHRKRPIDLHIASWFWRDSYCPYRWGSRNLAFFTVNAILCCVFVGCVLRSVAVCLNISSKFVIYTTFFPEYFRDFVWFPTLVRPTLTVRGTARTHGWQTDAWQLFVCVPPITSRGLGTEFFHTLYWTGSYTGLRTGLHIVVNQTAVVQPVLNHHTDTSYPNYKSL